MHSQALPPRQHDRRDAGPVRSHLAAFTLVGLSLALAALAGAPAATASVVTVELILDRIERDEVHVAAVLRTGGHLVGGVQNDIHFDPSIVDLPGAGSCSIAPGIGTATDACDEPPDRLVAPCKTLGRHRADCGASSGLPGCEGLPGWMARFRAIIAATAVPNHNAIPDGAVLYSCRFILVDPAELPFELAVSGVVAADPFGARIKAEGVSVSIPSVGTPGAPTRTRTATPSPTATRTPTATRIVARTPPSPRTPALPPTPRPLGWPCDNDAGCLSGHCVDNACCDEAGCEPGMKCSISTLPGTCTTLRDDGSGCNSDDDCLSENCHIGHLSTPLGVAGVCAFPRTPTPLSGSGCRSSSHACPPGHFCNTREGGICCDQVECPAGQSCRVPGREGICSIAPVIEPETPPFGAEDGDDAAGSPDAVFASSGCAVQAGRDPSAAWLAGLALLLAGLRRRLSRRTAGCAVAALGTAAWVQPVSAFSLFPDQPHLEVRAAIETATRWAAEPEPFGFHLGLQNGLRVAVAADFAENLGATTDEGRTTVARVIRQAFHAWQTPELRFDVDFSRIPVEGVATPEEGYDIDLFAVPASHPAFGGQTYFGIAYVSWTGPVERLLTNGDRVSGLSTLKSDIFINTDTVGSLTNLLRPDQQAQALQRLLMHEIGHALGLGHPNAFSDSNVNFDADFDPHNVMRIDPLDPPAGLLVSPNRSSEAIMSNAREVRRFLFFTELQHDDRGGRDALYPSLTRCPGDCDGNGEVDVAEILTTVGVALGDTGIDACFRADLDDSNTIEVDEILRGVMAALEGCPASELFEVAQGAQRRLVANPSEMPPRGILAIHCAAGLPWVAPPPGTRRSSAPDRHASPPPRISDRDVP